MQPKREEENVTTGESQQARRQIEENEYTTCRTLNKFAPVRNQRWMLFYCTTYKSYRNISNPIIGTTAKAILAPCS